MSPKSSLSAVMTGHLPVSPFVGIEKLGKYADVETCSAHPARAYPAPSYSDSPKLREKVLANCTFRQTSCHSPALSFGYRTALVRSL